jgi:hypothetical protein
LTPALALLDQEYVQNIPWGHGRLLRGGGNQSFSPSGDVCLTKNIEKKKAYYDTLAKEIAIPGGRLR